VAGLIFFIEHQQAGCAVIIQFNFVKMQQEKFEEKHKWEDAEGISLIRNNEEKETSNNINSLGIGRKYCIEEL